MPVALAQVSQQRAKLNSVDGLDEARSARVHEWHAKHLRPPPLSGARHVKVIKEATALLGMCRRFKFIEQVGMRRALNVVL